MAVTAEKSAEYTKWDDPNTHLLDVSDWHGRLRARYFKFTQGVAAGDAGSTAELIHLPAGRVRVFGALSKVYFSAFGAARTLDVGNRLYKDLAGVDVAADAVSLASAVDVNAAGSLVLDEAGASARSLVFESQGGVDIFATVAGGTIPAGTIVEGYVIYVID